MRVFTDFTQARNEIQRDLKEMGVEVQSNHFQNIKTDDEDMDCFELTDYTYMVNDPQVKDIDLSLDEEEFIRIEFHSRLYSRSNPGRSWEARPDVWEEFLNSKRKFDYTYAERYNDVSYKPLQSLMDNIVKDKGGRRHYLPVWFPGDSISAKKGMRVPCSLGYFFSVREGRLNITYLQRACDFVTHHKVDLAITTMLMQYIVKKTKDDAPNMVIEPGRFTHWIGSFHVFKKDVEGVF